MFSRLNRMIGREPIQELPMHDPTAEAAISSAQSEVDQQPKLQIFGCMMSSMCSSIGTKLRNIQVPSIPRPSFPSNIWGRLSNASTTSAAAEPVPFAQAMEEHPDIKSEVCTICSGQLRFEPLQKDDDADLESMPESTATEFSSTPCKHNFHGICLRKWIEEGNNKTCPTCNQDI